MRKLSYFLLGASCALALLADPASANIRKKAGAKSRSYIWTSSSNPASTYWYVSLDGFETTAQASTTYQAIGVLFDKTTKAGGALRSGYPTAVYFQNGVGATYPYAAGFSIAYTNSTVASGMSATSKLGTGALGYRSTVSGTMTAGRPIVLRFYLSFTAAVTKAEVAAMMAKWAVAIDECSALGVLKNTQFARFLSHPEGDYVTGSKTLPKGFDIVEGSTSHHPSWGLYKSTTTAYVPGRVYYSYAAGSFPWNPATAKTISELRCRQDSATTSTYLAHKAECSLYMSVDGFDPQTPRFSWLPDTCHGKLKTNVFPRATLNVTVPASPKNPPQPATFDRVYKFPRPFVVPANSKNVIIEQRTYKVSVTQTTSTRWRVDANSQGSSLDRGSLTRFGTQCPTSPTMNVSNFISWAGGEFSNYVDTGTAGAPVIGWLGTKLATPVKVTAACSIYVQGIVYLGGVADAKGRASLFWGVVPPLPSGTKIAYQFAVVKLGYPWLGYLGLSGAGEYSFGKGYTNAALTAASIYGYNFADPDKVAGASYLSTAAVIWEIR